MMQQLEKLVPQLVPFLVQYGWALLSALGILFLGKWASKGISHLVEKVLLRSKVDPTLCHFAANIVHVALLIFVAISTLNRLGIQTASLIAVVGAAGLAVGLALQGSLSNFAAGVMIIVLRPYKVGDFIQVCDTSGTVISIKTFHTTIRSSNKIHHVIPNSKITGDVVRNWSTFHAVRIELTFAISYDDDTRRAKEVLHQVVEQDQRIEKDPAPLIGVKELGSDGVIFACRIYTSLSDYWDVMYDTLETGKNALQDKGFTIPFPQREVRFHAGDGPPFAPLVRNAAGEGAP